MAREGIGRSGALRRRARRENSREEARERREDDRASGAELHQVEGRVAG